MCKIAAMYSSTMDWINKIYVWFNYRWTECVSVGEKGKETLEIKEFFSCVWNISSPFMMCVWKRAHPMCVCMDVLLCMWIFETTRNRKIQPQHKKRKFQRNSLIILIQTACECVRAYEYTFCTLANSKHKWRIVYGVFSRFFQTKWKCVCMISSNFSVNKKATTTTTTITNQRHGIVTTAAATTQSNHTYRNIPCAHWFWRTLLFSLASLV